MSPRLGLRSRILALTMPVVLLVSAAIAGIVYLSLGQVLEASAREIAAAEAAELRAELSLHTVDDLMVTHELTVGNRVAQIVDEAGVVVVTTDAAVTRPLADPAVAPGEVRLTTTRSIPGLDERAFVVAAADAPSLDGRRYTALVAVATQVDTTALRRSTEFALIGAVGLIALLGAVTTFAVGQALRPVERMRDQVEDIASSRPAPALEVPAGRDELAKLAETLNGVLDRLRRADASRRAFVADAGHELRSPLATIRVLLDRLAEDRPLEERRLVAARASAEVDRLSLLVDDLLTLASADEHAMTLQVAEVDLDDIVLAESGVLRARGMPLDVSVEPVRVRGDAMRLGRVVRNLLENAERHREDAVRLALTRDGDSALVVVDNDGPPVAPEDRSRVFARFVRLDDSRTRDTGGAGLGLAIVAEIVRAHGGTVVAEESPEGWCRFAVRLPTDTRPG
ncbi:ATP-binding protein [Fodinibacter luteus]|uniref:histidine kinase n=1 Tax=Fodinibacter luteus TaxID=552064 RepID=A0ABP8JXG9_9MICO